MMANNKTLTAVCHQLGVQFVEYSNCLNGYEHARMLF